MLVASRPSNDPGNHDTVGFPRLQVSPYIPTSFILRWCWTPVIYKCSRTTYIYSITCVCLLFTDLFAYIRLLVLKSSTSVIAIVYEQFQTDQRISYLSREILYLRYIYIYIERVVLQNMFLILCCKLCKLRIPYLDKFIKSQNVWAEVPMWMKFSVWICIYHHYNTPSGFCSFA